MQISDGGDDKPENKIPEPDTPWGDAFNGVVNKITAATGFDTTRVTETPGGPADNPFYRDNAQYMPGWGNSVGLGFLDPHGQPSGATAQDRATNYVGQGDTTGVFADVRGQLVQRESADIAALPKGPDGTPQGNLSFGQVYDAHVQAYDAAEANARASGANPTANNGFIDPASFAIATYGAPELENLGINAGPVTAASIDYFNNPNDSATAGWAKRTALNGGEFGLGTLLALNPVTAPVGLALMGTGAFGEAYNTVTAVEHGLPGEVGGALSSTANKAVNKLGDAKDGAGKLLGKIF